MNHIINRFTSENVQMFTNYYYSPPKLGIASWYCGRAEISTPESKFLQDSFSSTFVIIHAVTCIAINQPQDPTSGVWRWFRSDMDFLPSSPIRWEILRYGVVKPCDVLFADKCWTDFFVIVSPLTVNIQCLQYLSSLSLLNQCIAFFQDAFNSANTSKKQSLENVFG